MIKVLVVKVILRVVLASMRMCVVHTTSGDFRHAGNEELGARSGLEAAPLFYSLFHFNYYWYMLSWGLACWVYEGLVRGWTCVRAWAYVCR